MSSTVTVGVEGSSLKIYAKDTKDYKALVGDTYKYKIEDGYYICFTVKTANATSGSKTEAVYTISITNS